VISIRGAAEEEIYDATFNDLGRGKNDKPMKSWVEIARAGHFLRFFVRGGNDYGVRTRGLLGGDQLIVDTTPAKAATERG